MRWRLTTIGDGTFVDVFFVTYYLLPLKFHRAARMHSFGVVALQTRGSVCGVVGDVVVLGSNKPPQPFAHRRCLWRTQPKMLASWTQILIMVHCMTRWAWRAEKICKAGKLD